MPLSLRYQVTMWVRMKPPIPASITLCSQGTVESCHLTDTGCGRQNRAQIHFLCSSGQDQIHILFIWGNHLRLHSNKHVRSACPLPPGTAYCVIWNHLHFPVLHKSNISESLFFVGCLTPSYPEAVMVYSLYSGAALPAREISTRTALGEH